jgi:putative acetyltransferase
MGVLDQASAWNMLCCGMTAAVLIRPARFGGGQDDADLVRSLMREYAAHLNHAAGGEHICVASLEIELQNLPGAYAEPEGAILLAFVDKTPVGCVALKPLNRSQPERVCEMTRLWVRPEFQGQRLGRRLAETIIEMARTAGYSAIHLSTMPETMQAAHAIYISLGFTPVEQGSPEVACLRRSLASAPKSVKQKGQNDFISCR